MSHVTPPAPPRAGSLTVAGLASIGAGAIHAVAAGAHNDHQEAVWLFSALAAVQIGWGVLALRRPQRPISAAGLLLALGSVAGWVGAKTVGLGFVDGLAGAEPAQAADALAAGLAGVALIGCALRLLSWVPLPALAPAVSLAVVAAVVPGMVAAGTHDHDHGGAHADGAEHAHGDGDHGHGDEVARGADLTGHGHEAAVVPPEPYDPELPIDLGGVDGVTPQQQARAENLIAVTLLRLPKYADPAVAEADGYRSIGDGATGYEHYINQSYIDDDKILDPDFPESLVYQLIGGEKTLVAAMYMLPADQTLDDIPDVGGRLTQWHIHDDLCFTDDPEAPKVGGLTLPDGTCEPPLVKGVESPMLHVWIVPHECGPFAALEGVAGGQIAEGEERWCDHVHGTGAAG